MIYIETTAYNAGKTLRRAVESVLNQVHGDFIYYLTDNGSRDQGETRGIVEEYARRDSRIVPFFNKENHVWDENKAVIDLPYHIGEEDFFCMLDADDEYCPDFFSTMLQFINEYSLDIGACGVDYILPESVERIKIFTDLILHEDLFAVYFPQYHWYMRNVWGKLFKGKALLRHEDSDVVLCYGNDTKFTMDAFSDATRVGIYSDVLCKNHVMPKSSMYSFRSDRIACDQILNKRAHGFLSAYGKINRSNEIFLQKVFLNACMNTLDLLLKAEMDPSETLHLMMEILCYPYVTDIVKELRGEKEHSLRDARRQVIGGLYEMVVGWIAEHREELPASDRWIGDSVPHKLEI